LIITIRQAMYREMDTTRLQAYILFVSQHVNDMTKEELTELIEDVSQLVTTRETMLNGLVDPLFEQGVKTYQALLQLFTCGLQKSLQSSEFSLQWSIDQQKVHVNWGVGTLHANMSANLHIRVIHASIVLLTCSPSPDNNADYALLLKTWFPEAGQYEVRLADTGEEAVILHDWLRMKMVRSGLPQLVNSALTGLVPEQLVLFMQTFGLPVESVSKLLHSLDEAAVENPSELSQAIVDRDYLYQLVEIHWARGATNGEALAEFLGQDGRSEKQDVCDLSMLEETMSPFSIHVSSPEYMKEEIRRPVVFNEEYLQQLLFKLYNEEILSKETASAFSELKKTVGIGVACDSRDKSAINALICAFDQILQSESKDKFIASLYQHTEKTHTLLYLLFKAQEKLDEAMQKKFLNVLKSIRKKGHEGNKVHSLILSISSTIGLSEDAEVEYSKNSELRNALTEFLNMENSKPVSQALSLRICYLLKKEIRNGTFTIKELDMKLFLDVCHLMQEKQMPILKRIVDAFCYFYVNVCDSNKFDSIKLCVQLLVDLYKYGKWMENDFSSGFIQDWLEILDPEIIHVDPLLQRDALFMDRMEIHGSADLRTTGTSPSYLRALLSHQPNENTLFDCISWLLSVDVKSSRLNPTAALDLISSVVSNPKQWQGRDSKQNSLDEDRGRRINDEVKLDFSVPQLCKLMELILAEMELLYHPERAEPSPRKTESEKTRAHTSLPANVASIAEKRLPLLLNHVTGLSYNKMEKVAGNIRRMKRFPKPIINCLLYQVYLHQPNLLSISMQEMLTKESSDRILQGDRSSADDLIHSLMLAIANTKPETAWEDEFHNFILLCRRLAVKHPLLILRHLQTLLSVMQGRHRIGSSEFNASNQLVLFAQVLSLLDLLRPYIFLQNPVAQEGLRMAIDIYIDLVQSECINGSEEASIVLKFVEFLNNLIAFDSSYAFSLLSLDTLFFRDLSLDHSSLVGLKFLCTFLSMGEDSLEVDHKIFSTPVIPSSSSPWNERQLSVFKQKLFDFHNSDGISKVLLDLDETSKRRADILQHFLDELVSFIYSDISEIREKAHHLLLRHYRNQPRSSKMLVDAYMKALTTENPDVALSAAKFIPQVILLCDDGSLSLVTKLFEVATSNRLETKEFVLQSVINLNVDT